MKKLLPVLVAIISLYIGACKKDAKIGANLLPATDLSNAIFTDTFTVNAKTENDTFLRTDKLAKNYLGIINDPKFGFQKANIAVELDRPNLIYGDSLRNFTVDSAYLLLRYYTIYGDTNVAQDIQVSEINTNINPDLLYYSNNTTFSGSTILGQRNSYKYVPTRKETVSRTDTTGISNALKIPISNTFAQAILDLPDSIQRDTIEFRNRVKGLFIENASLNGNAMAEFDFNSIYSGLYIYFKDKHNNNKDIRLQTYIYGYINGVVSQKKRSVNLYQNTLSPQVQSTIASSAISDSIIYFLGQSGTRVKISLPTIANLGKQTINLATIELTQMEDNSIGSYSKPQSLFLLKRNSSGDLAILPTNEGVAIFDTTATDDFGRKITRYRFNITRYMQTLVSGSGTNSDLYITNYPPAGTEVAYNNLSITPKALASATDDYFGYAPERVILAGSNNSNQKYKLKLKLYYTLLK